MVPRERLDQVRYGKVPGDALLSGVMILFFPSQEGVHIILIQRPDYQGVHGGQIGFPGGKMEAGDATILETALRETQEEIGIQSESIEVVGKLSPLYIHPSNFLVHSFTGLLHAKPCFKPDLHEVTEVLSFPLEGFFSENVIQDAAFNTSTGFRVSSPCYHIYGYRVWGATAMIISELLEVLRRDINV